MKFGITQGINYGIIVLKDVDWLTIKDRPWNLTVEGDSPYLYSVITYNSIKEQFISFTLRLEVVSVVEAGECILLFYVSVLICLVSQRTILIVEDVSLRSLVNDSLFYCITYRVKL